MKPQAKTWNIAKTYWSSKGKYNADYNRLFKKLVPATGKAKSKHGELLRALSKIYYDVYNNGLCNVENQSIQESADTLMKWVKEINEALAVHCRPVHIDMAIVISHIRDKKWVDVNKDTKFALALERVTDAVITIVKQIDAKKKRR